MNISEVEKIACWMYQFGDRSDRVYVLLDRVTGCTCLVTNGYPVCYESLQQLELDNTDIDIAFMDLSLADLLRSDGAVSENGEVDLDSLKALVGFGATAWVRDVVKNAGGGESSVGTADVS